MKQLRALDLFCGAGGASMGLHRAGFEVTGVDIAPQPHYPFQFVQADAMTFPLDGYDLIWASPPCQAYTVAGALHKRDHPRLIPEARRILATSRAMTILENVPGAPLRADIVLCGAMFGLQVRRHRLFECNFPLLQPGHQCQRGTTRSHRSGGKQPCLATADYLCIAGHNYVAADGRRAMDIDWMPRSALSQAIPPAYSAYLGKQARAVLEAAA